MAKLERVFGSTACLSSVSVDAVTGLVAYPAGSTVVIHNPRTLSQVHLISSSKNQITSLQFSPNGRYIATGEFGGDPKVRVWELSHTDRQSSGEQLAELKYHRLGITCVGFTKDSSQLISVGNQHDKSVVLWDWHKGSKLAENRLTSQVNAMAVCEKMFVTVGVRHVKFWYLEKTSGAGAVMLQGRSAILADHRNNTFVDVCCASRNRTFAITITKLLVEFVDKKLINIYELGGESPFSLTMGHEKLFIGFGGGNIRIFDVDSMGVELTLCKPHHLKCDIAASPKVGTSRPSSSSGNEDRSYPDVHSIIYHEKSHMLTALYADRSIYNWQIGESGQIIKVSSQLFHVGPIFDLELARHSTVHHAAGTFFTGGADETVRIWNFDEKEGGLLAPNIYSNELRKILYLGQGVDSLSEQADKNFGGILSDTLDSTTGVRCLKISRNGEHLACGGRDGNICVFDLTTKSIEKVADFEAHDGEVLCLEYTDPYKIEGLNFLASGSRDRLIHIFDASNHYEHLAVIDDHSSSISSVKFLPLENRLQIVTYGTDKVLVIREVVAEPEAPLLTKRLNQISSQMGSNCLNMTLEGNILTACQDRQLRTFSPNGKLLKTVKGTNCDEGTLTKFCLDPSELFAATVCSDRYVYITDVSSGECVAMLTGQSDSVTSIQFTPDCRRIIVVSYNGCIFVWRLSLKITKRMNARLSQNLSANSTSDRCITPDSLIESGSDSASVVASKKGSRKSTEANPLAPSVGSEFGSLTSVNIAQEDDQDLDSGIGVQSGTLFTPSEPENHRLFELRRIPTTEVIRRSTSNLNSSSLNQENTDSTWELNEVDEMQGNVVPGYGSILAGQKQQPKYVNNNNGNRQFVQAPFTNSITPSSRSMSNLHRANVSPQRTRRRWNVPAQHNGSSFTSPNNSQNFLQGQIPAASQNMYSPNTSNPYNNNTSASSFVDGLPSNNTSYGSAGMSNSFSLNALRNFADDITPSMKSSPKYGQNSALNTSFQPPTDSPANYLQQLSTPPHWASASPAYENYAGSYSTVQPPSNKNIDGVFERQTTQRNSFSKRYLNNIEEKTLWTPATPINEQAKRRSSNFFNSNEPTPSENSLKTRNSEGLASSSAAAISSSVSEGHSRRRFQSRDSNANSSFSRASDLASAQNSLSSSRLLSRIKQQRRTTEIGNNVDSSVFRSRSRSPSQLAMQYIAAENKLDSSTPSPSSTIGRSMRNAKGPSSAHSSTPSRSNTRLSSVTSNLPQTTKLQEAREMLKKSQENLSAAAGLLSQSTGSSSMARSRSIGNLKFSAAQSNDALDESDSFFTKQKQVSGLLTQNRQMARSANSLNKPNLESDDFSKNTLKAQYETVTHKQDKNGSTSQLKKSLAQSIKDLRKNSNSDLTNMNLLQEDGADSNLVAQDSYGNQYYSTLPKNLRRGVQKKLDKNASRFRNPAEQTTTSGESDNNTPELASNQRHGMAEGLNPANSLSPTTTFGGGHTLLSLPQRNEVPTRSVSSVEAMGRFNRPGTRAYDQLNGISTRKTPNYLAQRFGMSDFGAPDMVEVDDICTARSQSSSIDLSSSLTNIAESDLLSTQTAKKMAMHASECIQEMTKATDKLLGTRQLINKDTSIEPSEKETLLAGVGRAIGCFRVRLDSALPEFNSSNL